MNKLFQLKRALLVFAILSFALIGLFAALYIMYPMFANHMDASVIGPALSADFTIVGQSFVMPFAPTQAAEFEAVFASLGGNAPLIISVVIYVLSGLILILLALGIVYVSNKRKPAFGFYSLAVIISLYIAYIEIIFGIKYLALAQQSFSAGPSFIGVGVMYCAVFGLGCLAFVATIVTVVLGFIYAKKSANKQVEEEVIPQSIAEAAGDPEAVQEGEELNGPAEVVAIESEPEPVSEEANAEEPVLEEEIPEEPQVAEEPKEEKQQNVEVNVNNSPNGGIDQASLATLLREVVRDIVRDEIARNNLNQPQQSQQNPSGNQTITGATFGGPLVVQYFNGGINGVASPTPAVVENKSVEKVVEIHKEAEPAPAPAPVEEKKEEPKPASRPLFVKKEPVAEEKPAEPTPVVEANPAPAPVEEKKYERLSFVERLLQSEKDVHDLYNEIKNEILSYGVKSRVSAVGDTFRLHKKMYVRITVAGKSLKLYFALNPADYANSTLPIQDASDKDMYQEIPLVFKVKSPLSVRRCKELIQDVMEKDGLEQGEVGKVNWIKELKAEEAKAKKEKE